MFSCFSTCQSSLSIRVIKDIEYSQALNYLGEKVSLKLDVYQNIEVKKNQPVIILVHGGGFSGGDKGYTKAQGDFYPKMAEAFAGNGYIVFSLNYRLWPGCPVDSFQISLDNAVSDVLTAVKWIKNKSAEYKIDTTNIIICGDSAGGGLAVNASYCAEGVKQFKGCINMWGGIRPYGKENTQAVNVSRIGEMTPPTCIIHGTSDTVVPYSISLNLASQLTAAGVYNELYPLPGEKHYPVKIADQLFDIIITFSNKIIGGHN